MNAAKNFLYSAEYCLNAAEGGLGAARATLKPRRAVWMSLRTASVPLSELCERRGERYECRRRY